MSARDVLTLIGLVLTLAGAVLLTLGDAFPGKVTWATTARGNPNRHGWRGFALIAAGTACRQSVSSFSLSA